jgi:hypothetical protein
VTSGALAVETSSDPTGVIIGVIVGVIVTLVLALAILHRRRHDMHRKKARGPPPLQRPTTEAHEPQPATAAPELKPVASEGIELGELTTAEAPGEETPVPVPVPAPVNANLNVNINVNINVNVPNFTHTFTEQVLGLKLEAEPQGRIVVTGSAPDAPSASKSIPTGAFLEKVNGVSTAKKSMQEVKTMLIEGKRPITLEFSTAEPALEAQSKSVLVPRLPDLTLPVATAAPNGIPALGRRHAIGSSVYLKRSNGEETVAYVKEYNVEKALYTVELEKLGSGKTKTCRDKDLRAVDMVEGLLYSARAAIFYPFQAAHEPEPAEEVAQAEEAARAAAEEVAQAEEAARAAAEEAAQAEAARVQVLEPTVPPTAVRTIDELRNRRSTFNFPRHVVPPAAFTNVRDVTRGQDSVRL